MSFMNSVGASLVSQTAALHAPAPAELKIDPEVKSKVDSILTPSANNAQHEQAYQRAQAQVNAVGGVGDAGVVESAIPGLVAPALQAGGIPLVARPEVIRAVTPLVSENASPAQLQHAYSVVDAYVGQVGGIGDAGIVESALPQRAAELLAADRTVPLNVSQVAPLVPAGTALGPFKTADDAAIAMMNYSNPLSKAANLENGGLVLRDDKTGQFYVTTPKQGSLDGFNPADVAVPKGMTSIGAYHGHADYSKADGTRTDKAHDEFNSDHFSSQDKKVADAGYYGPVIWVSTPNGDFRKYDSATRQDTVIN